MIRRKALELVKKRLNVFSSVALTGPRQVGKTTIARQIAAEFGDGARYLDLENPNDRKQLDDPVEYFTSYADKLIVLDEVQRTPEIFQVLRGQIDERRRMAGKGGKFLMLGSASMDLLRQSSESLAGRISYVELAPFNPREVLADRAASNGADARSVLDGLWLKGGFPGSYLLEDVSDSFQWRADFIQTYLDRDIPQFGFQAAAEQIGLFWRMLANDQGELFNAQRYSRSMALSGHTIARYLDRLEKLLLVRTLQPWSVNTGKRLVKSPRPFVRDSGLLHALLNIGSMDALRAHPVVGKSWEGFVIESLIGACEGKARPYFYRTAAGAEADLVLEFAPGRCWAIEVKLSSAPTLDKGFHIAADDLKAERRILVHQGEAMPLVAAMDAVSAAAGASPG